jgi:DNA-binding CsgD family transcriptional regulator
MYCAKTRVLLSGSKSRTAVLRTVNFLSRFQNADSKGWTHISAKAKIGKDLTCVCGGARVATTLAGLEGRRWRTGQPNITSDRHRLMFLTLVIDRFSIHISLFCSLFKKILFSRKSLAAPPIHCLSKERCEVFKMDHLLVVPLQPGVPESFLNSLRQAGWRISVTSDVLRAKQLLQVGNVAGILLEVNSATHDPDRFKVLRFVHEFCPGTLVIMLNSGAEAFTAAGTGLVHALNSIDDARTEAATKVLDLYNLSPAQTRIADLVAQAYPNREIARRLRIKEQSVRNELSRVFKKMGVWNRVELALLMRNSQPEAVSPVEQPWPADVKLPTAELGTRASVS